MIWFVPLALYFNKDYIDEHFLAIPETHFYQVSLSNYYSVLVQLKEAEILGVLYDDVTFLKETKDE